MVDGWTLSRRTFLRGTAMGAAAVGSAAFPVCAAAKTVVGFIYVGPRDDFGYNQAHAQGAAAVARLPDVTVIEEENVAETVAVQKTMASMINLDGARLLFPTSFGYFEPHILKVAMRYPDVTFLHAGGLYEEGKHPKNVGSYFGYIDEARYLAGIVAGQTSKTGKLGFIAAKPIPQVLRSQCLYSRGAQCEPASHNPGDLYWRLGYAHQRSGSYQQPGRSRWVSPKGTIYSMRRHMC